MVYCEKSLFSTPEFACNFAENRMLYGSERRAVLEFHLPMSAPCRIVEIGRESLKCVVVVVWPEKG